MQTDEELMDAILKLVPHLKGVLIIPIEKENNRKSTLELILNELKKLRHKGFIETSSKKSVSDDKDDK